MFIQTVDNLLKVLGYVSNSTTFEITKVDNSSKCLGGGNDNLNVCMVWKLGTLKTYRSICWGGGTKLMKLSIHTF